MTGYLRRAVLLCLFAAPALAADGDNLLANPSFEDGPAGDGVPKGWSLYAGTDQVRRVSAVETASDGKLGCQIEDGTTEAEVGITQSVPARGGLAYRCSLQVRRIDGATPVGCYLQMRFLPSNEYGQVSLMTRPGAKWREISVSRLAPADTTQITIYIYCHREPTPRFIVDDVRLVSGATVEAAMPVPPPVPPDIPRLKDLHVQIPLVAGGQPRAVIIAPAVHAAAARRVQEAVRAITGASLPIAGDQDPAAAVPLAGNLIVLGNRSDNHCLSDLYDRYYTLLDLKYPGSGGYAVHSLHNPFGNGFSALLAGGSDAAGTDAAADALIRKLQGAGGKAGELSAGWILDVKLSPQYQVPDDIRQVQTWEASDGYGSSGYFGWNMISKHMALYYMTGDERHAREALRLALPDQQAKAEIAAIDGEMIENKDAPLSGPYHYNATMMVLYWDLIEEAPVFTDEERLKVTHAFAQQLLHRRDEGSYGLTEAPTAVGSRHGQWSAMSLYCLGRYLNAGYPDPVWAQCMRGAQLHFAPLYESAYIAGESDNLYWFDTGIAPIFAYMVLTGDRKPFDSGSAQTLLKAQEALVTGRPKSDFALRYAAYSYLNQLAYLTGDGRWITYRNRTNLDPSVFRVGQSFWPDEAVIKPHQPDDLTNVWTLDPLPEPHFYDRGSGLPMDQSLFFGSFRSAPDSRGDYILVDPYNGASRNPYHTFAVLQLRLGGQWVLKSSGNSEAYYNQVLTCADGMVEPSVAMDAALRWHDLVGEVAGCVAEVPNAAFSNWRRTMAQRVGRYALFVDDLTFRTDSRNMAVETYWETGNGAWNAKEQALTVPNDAAAGVPAGWLAFRALDAACTSDPAGPADVVRLDGLNALLLRATQPGQWLELPFTLDRPATGEVFADLLGYLDRGTVKFLLDGKPAGDVFDLFATAAVPARPSLGHQALAAGRHTLRVEVAGRHEDGEKTYIGLVGLSVKPDGVASPADLPRPIEIRPCDPQPATGGGILKLTWQGAVKSGEHRLGFTLIAPSGPGDQAAACVRVAANAAALALSEPAVASVGAWQGSDGELVVLAATHLFGIKLAKAGGAQPLALASAPVDLDWDFATGDLSVVAAADTELRLALDPATLAVAGKPVQRVADGLASLPLTAGRHSFKGVKPAPAALTALRGTLAEALGAGRTGHAQRTAALGREAPPAGAPLQPAWTATLGGKPEALEVGQTPGGPLIWAATEKQIHALGADGAAQRQMPTDGPIRVLHYWPDAAGKDGAAPLLLAGCRDEKVIAFDLAGQRRWTFVSEMDPEVFRAAKQYWFKTAPGHEGIHGIGSGPFIDGKSEAFIGSACTLEILNADGGLDKRLAAFWGTGNVFQLLPGPGGSTNLLLGRMPTDGLHLYTINNRDVRANNYSFYGVPPGHTYVGGWASQARKHLFYADLDGDGTKEVASEVNGSWNRVSVWDVNGVPLYNAQFGPGNPIPAENITDIDLSDLNGDGKQEFVLGLSRGLVVALSSHCERLWSASFPSPPWRLQAVGRQVLVGCADGSFYVLDGEGTVAQAGKLDSRPLYMEKLATADGRTLVVAATEKGTVAGFVL